MVGVAQRLPYGDSACNGVLKVADAIRAWLRVLDEFNRVITVINGTGWGKSFTVIQLLQMFRGVYFLCEDIDTRDHEGLAVQPTWKTMIETLKNPPQDMLNKYHTIKAARTFVADRIVRCVCEAAKRFPTAADLFDAQCDDGFTFMGELQKQWEATHGASPSRKMKEVYFGIGDAAQATVPSPSAITNGARSVVATSTEDVVNPASANPPTTPQQPPKGILKKTSPLHGQAQDEQAQEDRSSTDEAAEGRSTPLLIFFDEASGLVMPGIDSRDEASPMRCLMRAVNISEENVAACVLSTSSRLYDLCPGHKSSSKETLKKDYPPIVGQVVFPDVFWDHGCFALGRPLWGATLLALQQQKTNAKPLFNLMELAQKLLLGENKKTRDESDKLRGREALVACRLSMNPYDLQATLFVENHLATACEAVEQDESVVIRATYHSEPIVAEASAYLTTFHQSKGLPKYNLATILDNMLRQAQSSPLNFNLGDCGEFAVMAALMYSLDELRYRLMDHGKYLESEEHSFSMPLSVMKLLQPLLNY